MYLKSITLKGFKSFPERTRLEFGPGVSVIVGPNGSGKSNVTDAVLWALGEQSPLAVRGQSMQDVIFGGAPGRQGAKTAEVELVLDDSDGTLNLGVPEISIVRRLDRTGEGEYRLAGARCRLVDVIELLSDTGLGKEMHSVISQGRVESIVTSKPRDRRLLIEEAAGLGKHRKRRRRAQLKLERTQENLDRALDVEREARSALRPLKRQAEAAELHARLERQTLEVRWELARDELRTVRETLAAAEAEAGDARARREAAEQSLQEVAGRRQAAEEALAARSAQREELSRRCFVAQAATDRISYRGEAIRAHAATNAARAARAHAQLEAIARQPSPAGEDPGATARIEALEAELAALERDREAQIAQEVAELERERDAALRELELAETEIEGVRSAREEADRRLAQAQEIVRTAERGLESARREAARVGGELAAVNQFLRSRSPGDAQGGALADGLEVDAGYELALAAVLDGRLTAAVVEHRAAGAALLDRAGTEGGRVLVAADAEEPHDPRGAAPAASAERLADHVRGSGQAATLARKLLAETWIVGSFDELSAGFTGTAVTRQGRVWSPAMRELRQAPALGDDRLLAERNRRDELIRATERAAQTEQSAHEGLARATEDVGEREREQGDALSSYREALRTRDEAAEQVRRLEGLIEARRAATDNGPSANQRSRLSAELAAERRLAERAQREHHEHEQRITSLRAESSRCEELAPVLENLLTALERATEAIATRTEQFQSELEADRQAGEHMAAELRACAQEETTLQTQLHSENEALMAAEVRAQQIRDRAADSEQEVASLARRLDLAPEPLTEGLSAEERDALAARYERLIHRREQLGPVNPLAQEQYAEAVAHVEELERQRSDLEQALRELQKLIADTDRQIRETFEATYAAAASNFEQLAAQLFPGGSGRLRLVTERDQPPRVLGGEDGADEPAPDEPAAGDELPEEERQGVEIEITPAGKSMKRLTLLSGGEKSMTALAFLFAVFLARPCPFYILDEVEAALDDLNIDRFLDLLREYSARAQFIVVTHQKRTMEAADSLYGVSMGSDGISKVVSRRLPQEAAA